MTGSHTRPTPQQILAAREVLCVEPDASRDEIVAVWRAAVRLTHPDTARPEASEVAKRMNQQVNEARDILLAVLDDDARLRIDEDFMAMLRGDPPRDQTIAQAAPPPPPAVKVDPVPPPPRRQEPVQDAPAAAAPPPAPPPAAEPDPPRVEEHVAQHATAAAPPQPDDTGPLGPDPFAPAMNGHGAHGTVGFDAFAPLPPRPPVPPAPPRKPNVPRARVPRPPVTNGLHDAPAETAATMGPQVAPMPTAPVPPTSTNGHPPQAAPAEVAHEPAPAPERAKSKSAKSKGSPYPKSKLGISRVRPAVVIAVGLAILLLALVALIVSGLGT